MALVGKSPKKGRRGSKSYDYQASEAEEASFAHYNDDESQSFPYGLESTSDIVLESPRRVLMVPSHTIYPMSAYVGSSVGGDRDSKSQDPLDDDDDEMESFGQEEPNSTPLFKVGSSRAVPIPMRVEAVTSVEADPDRVPALLSSKHPEGGMLWRTKGESALGSDWSMMTEGKVKIWYLKKPSSLSANVRNETSLCSPLMVCHTSTLLLKDANCHFSCLSYCV